MIRHPAERDRVHQRRPLDLPVRRHRAHRDLGSRPHSSEFDRLDLRQPRDAVGVAQGLDPFDDAQQPDEAAATTAVTTRGQTGSSGVQGSLQVAPLLQHFQQLFLIDDSRAGGRRLKLTRQIHALLQHLQDARRGGSL